MKRTFKIFEILLLMCGVFGADTDEVESVSVMEGDSVTLNHGFTQIQGVIQILWRFGEPGLTIAQIDENGISFPDDERFKDRLQLNHQTGSLTIKNMRIKHSGLYKLKIDHNTGTSDRKFSVAVYESPSVIAAGEAERQIMSVTTGDPVTLHVPQLTGDVLIVWRFGDEGKLIAKHDIEAKSSPLYDTDERFRDRLKLDRQTGSLIITKTRTTDSGLYTVKISSNKQTLYKRFTVTVSAVPDSGLSPAAVAGIVGVVSVLLVAAAAAGVMYYRRPRTSNLPSLMLSALEGDPVPLNPDTKIQTADEIQWLFGDKETLIAEIKGENREMTTYKGPDRRFRDRLKLDKTTGSLTIKVIAIKHNGLYTLKIRRGRETLYKRFYVSVNERNINVMEGDPVILNPDTGIKTGDEIQWLFGAEETLIAKIKGETREIPTYDGPDGIFKDRLELKKTIGSLTITNSTAEHTGLYTLKIRRGRKNLYKRFSVSVREREIEVMEGDPVTLKPATEIQTSDEIQWLFRDKYMGNYMIAEIKEETREIFTTCDDHGGTFKDRLKLDKETGSLTITNTTNEHAGLYTRIIRRGRETLYKRLFVYVREREIEVMKGDPVTLKPNKKIVTEEKIQWLFGDEEQQTLIAELTVQNGEICTYDDVADGIFKNRLELNKTTGSLAIKNSMTEHSGLYKLEITSSSWVSDQTFIVTVKDCTGKRVNVNTVADSMKPLLNEVYVNVVNGEDVNVVNEQEGTSSL